MSSVRILAGDTERIQTPAVKDGALAALTGLSTVVVAIQRVSDGLWLDFADSTFKASGWTTRQQTMTEVSATLAPGEYYRDWTAPTGADAYMVRVDETGGTAKNTPFHGEIKVDGWIADDAARLHYLWTHAGGDDSNKMNHTRAVVGTPGRAYSDDTTVDQTVIQVDDDTATFEQQ